MNPSQIAWAASHDWYIKANGDGSVTVWDGWYDPKLKTSGGQPLTFNSFPALRAWAGY